MKKFNKIKTRSLYKRLPDESKKVLEFFTWLRYLKNEKNDPLYKDYIYFWNQCIEIIFNEGLDIDGIPCVVKAFKKKTGYDSDPWITAWFHMKDNFKNLEALKEMNAAHRFTVTTDFYGRITFEFKTDEELEELYTDLYGD